MNKLSGEAEKSLPLGEGGTPSGVTDEGRYAVLFLRVGAAAHPAR